MKVARRSGVAPFYVMEVMKAAARRAAAGGEVLHLEVGQPSTPAPGAVIEEAKRALSSSRLGYTDAHGVPELRNRSSQLYEERYGELVDVERLVGALQVLDTTRQLRILGLEATRLLVVAVQAAAPGTDPQ